MADEHVKVALQLDTDQLAWLEDMTATYDLASLSAALRAALSYVIENGDEEEIFTSAR